ncbi:AAA family ATPase [Candidatus Pacearchaeota archaeon]|jgi:replicative DNA helicase|nr:AAA family ATPase [Candidatus Pacearchaeota archaeon]
MISIEFEKALLKLVIENEQIRILCFGNIKPNDFSKKYLAEIYNFVENYYKKGKQLTYDILKIQFETYTSYIEEINNLEVNDTEYYSEKLVEFVKRARMEELVNKALGDFQDGKFINYDLYYKTINDICSFNLSSTYLGIELFDDFDSYFDLLITKRIEDHIRTGITELDKMLHGGVNTGDLSVMMAGSGQGKTTFLINMAHGALSQRKSVLYITLEIEESYVLERLIRRIMHATFNDILVDQDKVKEILGKFCEYTKSKFLVYESLEDTLTTSNIESKILPLLQQTKEFKPDVILIDYIDLMRSNDDRYGGTFKYEEQGSIAQEMKQMAKRIKVPIFTVSQVTASELSKKVLTEKSMAGSKEKFRKADNVWALLQEEAELEANMGRLFVSKARNVKGRGAQIPVLVDLDRMLIGDI